MRKIFCAVLALMLFFLSALAEDEIPTAAELFERNPSPDVPLSGDPYIDPLLRLTNKQNGLPWDYVPELREVNVLHKKGIATQQMVPEAADALEEMFAAAEQDGITLAAVSGYRSYSAQKLIYNRKVEERGSAAALTSAPPGHSEHQLGLAMDISCKSISYRLNASFADTEEGQWLAAHCAEYGFIIRYKKEWMDITGNKRELWHVRYIGREHARLVQELNVPYETYLEYLELCWTNKNLDIPE